MCSVSLGPSWAEPGTALTLSATDQPASWRLVQETDRRDSGSGRRSGGWRHRPRGPPPDLYLDMVGRTGRLATAEGDAAVIEAWRSMTNSLPTQSADTGEDRQKPDYRRQPIRKTEDRSVPP